MRWWIGLTVLSAVVGLAGGVAAAGFTQPAGGLYLKVWDRSLIGSRVYLADGSGEDTGETYQDHALNYYVEYGLTDEWTLLSTGRPLGWAQFGDESTAYVGDLRIGVRRALVRGRLGLTGEVSYGYAPDVGTDAIGEGLARGQPFVYAPTVENHSVDLQLGLGYSLPWGWFSLAAGFRVMAEVELDHVVHASTGLAYAFAFGLVLEPYFAYHQPLGEVEATNVSGAGQTRYLGFGLDLSYWVSNHWSINLGVGGVVFAESNAGTPALQLGFAFQN